MVANTMDLAAVRGRMGNRDFYVVMFPLALVPRYFKFNDWSAMTPEQRAQRVAHGKARAGDRAVHSWITRMTGCSALSPRPLTRRRPSSSRTSASISESCVSRSRLISSSTTASTVAQGIEQALEHNRELGKQHISVVLFPWESLEASQQVFSDLNRTVHKTSRSLDILYDHRDPLNAVTIAVSDAVPMFMGRVEKDRPTVTELAKVVALSCCTTPPCARRGSEGERRRARDRSNRRRPPATGAPSVTRSRCGDRS